MSRTLGTRIERLPTMKKTFKQRFRDWLYADVGSGTVHQDWPDEPQKPQLSFDNDRGMHFKVFKASGGTIIETNFYDRFKDRGHNSLHVIVDGEDIGKAIGKIITMETLKL